jgi:hypothetical protein
MSAITEFSSLNLIQINLISITMLITASVLSTACIILHCSNNEIVWSTPAQELNNGSTPRPRNPTACLPTRLKHPRNGRSQAALISGAKKNCIVSKPGKSEQRKVFTVLLFLPLTPIYSLLSPVLKQRQSLFSPWSEKSSWTLITAGTLRADSYIPCRSHAVPMPFPCCSPAVC